MFCIVCFNKEQQKHSRQGNDMPTRLFIPFWNTWLTRDTLIESLPPLAQFLDLLFDFYAYLNTIRPSEFELAIFSSFLLFNSGFAHFAISKNNHYI